MSASPFISLDPATLKPSQIYQLMIESIVPRPIAFVTTVNSSGQGNAAPFSFFNGVCSSPPILMFSVTAKRLGSSNATTQKDTLRNILETRQFVVNGVNQKMGQAIHQCSADYPYGIDEAAQVGLHFVPSFKVTPPRILESPLQMECELVQTLEMGTPGPGSSTLIFGKIIQFHFSNEVFKNGKVDFQAFDPLARLGGDGYGKTLPSLELKRPKI